MSIARKRRRKARHKRTWQEDLAEGKQQSATWRYLMERFGGQPGVFWATDADMHRHEAILRRRLVKHAAAFVQQHGLDAHWALATSGPVRRSLAYITDWILHLAHTYFGRPRHTWRDNKEQWRVTMAEAQRRIGELARKQRKSINRINATRQFAATMIAGDIADLRSTGLSVPVIAERLGISESSVSRALARDKAANSPDLQGAV